MNPEWLEWAEINMPTDMYKQMISSRNWDAKWRDTRIIELTDSLDLLGKEYLRAGAALRATDALLDPMLAEHRNRIEDNAPIIATVQGQRGE